MKEYFQKLFDDIRCLESFEQRIEKYMNIKSESPIEKSLFQMIYLTQNDADGLSNGWREFENFALNGKQLLNEHVDMANSALKSLNIDSNPELFAKPLIQGVLYLSDSMAASRIFNTGTILQGQLIRESLDILSGVEIKRYAIEQGLNGKMLQQAVGAGQIWQVGVDGMIATSELYQMSERENLDKQRGSEILAYAVLKDSFLKKNDKNELGQKIQQSMGTSIMAAEKLQHDLKYGSVNDWLCSQKRTEILDMVSTIKGNEKIIQALKKENSAIDKKDKNISTKAQEHKKEENTKERAIKRI